MNSRNIYEKNLKYWTERVPGYSEVNKLELATAQRRNWKRCLQDEIEKTFSHHVTEDLRVLDIGTGPGFFAIILCELGYDVTAVDLTSAMLEEARNNAGLLAGNIVFSVMDAEALTYGDNSFDVVVSRNLTWNLPHPEKAYAEWVRVLKSGGLLLNFDANWYTYLYEETAKAAYIQDRINSAEQGVWDQNIGENFDVMEDIARCMPLSAIRRPAWDMRQLSNLGVKCSVDEKIWQRVWSAEEKLNYASTPMFLIKAQKIM
jgi:ubiquinone/menaquinone biosynthesis C-methylase UbiE